ncbi:VC2046/SO_2500 family protein [Psychrosphaera aestuarii]|uniref:VC2046/SO_2500 family protein n=1 Tax=Psychrosphaera aestuarii TaxID=1266052 RepID=UPI001B32005A|nr:VC2046/SO_2500 family protein [Psychrosphaera aestuarii]
MSNNWPNSSSDHSGLNTNNNVIRESAYYSQFRRAVDSSDSQSFALLLSMITQDATEFDQFHQVDTPTNLNANAIADIFPTVKPDIYGAGNSVRASNQNRLVHNGQYQDVRLENTLKPEPLCYKTAVFDDELVNSLDFNVRQKLINTSLISKDIHTQRNSDVDKDAKVVNIHSIKRPNSMDIDLWFNTLTASRSLDLVG